MNALPNALSPTPELRRLAERVVWFKTAEAALRDPPHLVAHTLTFGTPDDVRTLRRHLADSQLREALERAPPGVFDARGLALRPADPVAAAVRTRPARASPF